MGESIDLPSLLALLRISPLVRYSLCLPTASRVLVQSGEFRIVTRTAFRYGSPQFATFDEQIDHRTAQL